MNEFQNKEKNLRQEYENLENKYNKTVWKLDSAEKENLSLTKQLREKENNEEFRYSAFLADESEQKMSNLIAKCKYLENSLQTMTINKKAKIKLYKKKLISLEATLNQIICDKDNKIQELEDKLKEFRKKNNKSPLRSTSNIRRNSANQLQEINNMIASLERSQNEYKQKYLMLQRNKNTPFAEINNLFDMLKNNEKRLSEAKRLQDSLLKSAQFNS